MDPTIPALPDRGPRRLDGIIPCGTRPDGTPLTAHLVERLTGLAWRGYILYAGAVPLTEVYARDWRTVAAVARAARRHAQWYQIEEVLHA